jgi:hypothetical protein
MQRAGELLKQFQALRSAAPEPSAGQVLEQINSVDRGSLMQALLAAGAREQASQPLLAVAGPYLARVDAAVPLDMRSPPKIQLFPLPPTLGPLRSVQADRVDGVPVLMVGAQHGIFVVRGSDYSDIRPYRDAESTSPLGFNRALWWPNRRQFCSTHSEAGLVCWDADGFNSPIAMRPAAMGIFPSEFPDFGPMTVSSMSIRGSGSLMGPRNLLRLNDEKLLFSAGGRVMTWDGKSVKIISEASQSEISTIIVDDQVFLAIHEDGMTCSINSDGDILSTERRFGRVRAAAALPWLGSSRVLIAADDGPVQCAGLNDPLITQYLSPHRGLRILAGSAAMVGAVSPDRQRVVLWNSWDGRQPAGELFVAAQTRHRIADICFG